MTLLGDHGLHNTKFSLKSLSPTYCGSDTRREVQFSTAVVTSVVPEITEELQRLLEKFVDIFAIPEVLPLVRGQELQRLLYKGYLRFQFIRIGILMQEKW